jgi:nucleotide-binding universal stress UspA family protein
MKPILVGVDGSECSQGALEYAAEEAALRGAPLHIVCVWDVPDVGKAISSYPAEFLKIIQEEAKEIVARARVGVAELKPDLIVNAEVIKGHPSDVICEEARKAALVVVGNRGRGGVASLLLGSVSHHVVHLAPCPVTVVRVETDEWPDVTE